MDTQPVEEIGVDAVETGNSPRLDPVTADTAEHGADSPGQPAESANLEAKEVPKNKEAEIESTDATDKVTENMDQTNEPAPQEPEVKEDASEQSLDAAEANMAPVVDPAGDRKEPLKEPEGDVATPEVAEDDGETPAKKQKVGEEETSTEPEKVFCEE